MPSEAKTAMTPYHTSNPCTGLCLVVKVVINVAKMLTREDNKKRTIGTHVGVDAEIKDFPVHSHIMVSLRIHTEALSGEACAATEGNCRHST